MAPFSIPAPCIVPLRVPSFGGPRIIDTQTKIELLCETYLAHEIFYTLDGTKPQPYAGIVQGSKHFKYKFPFCLPAGKITVKAVALNSYVHSMRSSVVTKYFEVVKAESDSAAVKRSTKVGKKEYPKITKKKEVLGDAFPTKILTNGNAGNINIELDKNILEDFQRKNSSSSVDDFPADLNYDVKDVVSESPIDTIANEAEELEGLQDENDDDSLSVSSPATENEQHSPKADSCLVDDPKKESCTEEGKKLKVEDKVPTCDANAEVPTYCIKCETVLQHCRSCKILNAITSKYCIQCGESLTVLCSNCKELNSVVAAFCHYCGRKLEKNYLEKEPQISYADRSIMAETPKTHASVQQTLSTVNMQTQTPPSAPRERVTRKDFLSPQKKKLPAHSPGRGYWHQQLDYICNHLKSYAYNNVEFRDSISEPMLSEFREAQVTKGDDSVTVTLSFSPFVWEKRKDSTRT